jgi:acyl carrier protein
MNADLSNTVQRLLADILSVSEREITVASSPDTHESWDSLQHLNFVLAVEQQFGVTFKPEEIENITSVRSMIDTLETKLTPPSP